MQLLLDSNILIALTAEELKTIGRNTVNLLEDGQNQLFMSYFSLMEIMIKYKIGKLPVDPRLIAELQNVGIELLTPTQKEIDRYQIFDSKNKDPFVDFIITHCMNTGCALVTKDQAIINLKTRGLTVIDARQ
jgi:PIN domain nuclease of toxin-antitoxin system